MYMFPESLYAFTEMCYQCVCQEISSRGQQAMLPEVGRCSFLFVLRFISPRRMGVCATSHYNDAIMGATASQITSLTSVCSAVYSMRRSKKTSKLASLAFVWWIHRWPVNSPHKGPVTRKMFPFDDVIVYIIETETNWPPFCRQYFQIGILARKLIPFYPSFTALVPKVQINNNPSLAVRMTA